MMTTQERFAEARANLRAEQGLELEFYDAAEATRNTLFDDVRPTDEQLRALPIDAVLRIYGETDDAETLVAVELALIERDEELREYLASTVELAADLRIRAEGWKAYAKAKADAARQMEARADRITAIVRDYMQRTGEAKMDAGPHRLSLRANNPAVVITDASLLPADYTRTKTVVEPDKVAIKEALKSGLVIDGAELQQTWRVEIK